MTYQSVNPTLINVAVALAVCAWLFQLQRRRASFAVQVFTGMGLGVALGAVMHWVYGVESPVIKDTNAYLTIGTLMLTTLVAAGVGIGMANLFWLTAVIADR